MAKHVFLVTANVPRGVSLADVEDLIGSESNASAGNRHPEDIMIEVKVLSVKSATANRLKAALDAAS